MRWEASEVRMRIVSKLTWFCLSQMQSKVVGSKYWFWRWDGVLSEWCWGDIELLFLRECRESLASLWWDAGEVRVRIVSKLTWFCLSKMGSKVVDLKAGLWSWYVFLEWWWVISRCYFCESVVWVGRDCGEKLVRFEFELCQTNLIFSVNKFKSGRFEMSIFKMRCCVVRVMVSWCWGVNFVIVSWECGDNVMGS
jgi:hypothetical protein